MALAGVKVLEFVGLAPVPFCGQILRDFGARVLRIDNVRNPISSQFQMFASGKDTIKLNLKSPQGVEIVHRLIEKEKTDVLLDPFRPGVLERLNLGPDRLAQINERLIYARISGFGQDGPMSSMGGHDINYVSLSGVLSRLGARDLPPIPPINLLADFAGGSVLCALGILLALFERNNASGRGQVIDHSMTEGTSYLASFLWQTKQVQGDLFWPNYPQRASNMLDSGSPWYRCYETADSGRFLAVGALEEKFYKTFIKTIQKYDDPEATPALLDFEQYGIDQWPLMTQRIATVIRGKTRDQWEQIFAPLDACVTPVLELEEVAHSPLHQSRKSFCSESGVPTPAPKLSRTPGELAERTISSPATITKQVLLELGYSEQDIIQFADDALIDDFRQTDEN